jgi:hypothetical protein
VELHKFYSSPSIIGMVKSRRRKQPGHIARMGSRGISIDYWWESHEERDH